MSPPIPHPSLLHRLLKIEPGHAPVYLYSPDRCAGLDAPLGAVVLAFFCGLLLLSAAPPIGAILIALAVGFGFLVAEPFGDCERKARTRLRQAAVKYAEAKA